MNNFFKTFIVFISIFSTPAFAQELVKLKVTRNEHGKVSRIDFPPGFSIEYSWNEKGFPQRTYSNFLCEESGCLNTPDTAVLAEMAMRAKKNTAGLISIILSNDPDKFIQYFYDFIGNIVHNVERTKFTSPQEASKSAGSRMVEIRTTLNSTKTRNEQLTYLTNTASEESSKLIDFTFEGEKKNYIDPWYEGEKKLFETKIQKIQSCNPDLYQQLNRQLQENRYIRTSTFSKQDVMLARSFFDSPYVKVTVKDSKPDIKYYPEFTNEDSWEEKLKAGQKVISTSAKHIMSFTGNEFKPDHPHRFTISDKLAVFGFDNFVSLQVTMGLSSFRSEYFGDTTVKFEDVFTSSSNTTAWLLTHEYGHYKQFNMKDFNPFLTQASLARNFIISLGPEGKKTISEHLISEIRKKLVNPAHDLYEQSATYYALDQYPCF